MAEQTPIDYPARLRAALVAMQKQQATIARLEAAHSEAIAIVGIGCRFPGGADGPDRFWHVLRDGVDAISEVPADRWPVDAYFDPHPDVPGTMTTRWGGFLQDVDRFDARFFRISPREAVSMDPQQRLLLEVAWTALEDAAIDPSSLGGSQTGVFVGLTTLDYAKIIYRDQVERLDAYCATGNVANVASGRLSYFFGFRGPSLTVDTACSSSLVAVHLACQSLRTGESDLALAAGVNLILAPDGSIAVSRAHMLAPDGRCKTFDRSANGYARSEGCGVVVLKRLSKAIADRDRIRAVIRGSAVRQDGARSGLTVPNGPAQEAVIRAALQAAHADPWEVSYVEAHGTGTSLGDPIEVEALGHVFREQRPSSRPLVIGALKTNLGHMESAAGIGGVIKTTLALQHGEIPRHLHLETLHQDIALGEIPAVVPTRHLDWPAGYERRLAGVSSFGSSGTVAHVVLEAPPDPPAAATPPSNDDPLPWLLPISGATPRSLDGMRERYASYLETTAEPLGHICHTASIGRAHLACRRALVASSARDALASLRASVGAAAPPRSSGDRAIVFVCPDRSHLHAGAGRRLYDTVPAFRAAVDECDRVLLGRLPGPIASLLPTIDRHRASVAGPVFVALGYALATTWRTWGVSPVAVTGEGLGEYVAACISGLFTIEDALRLAAADTGSPGEANGGVASLESLEAALASVTFHAPHRRMLPNPAVAHAAPNVADRPYWLARAHGAPLAGNASRLLAAVESAVRISPASAVIEIGLRGTKEASDTSLPAGAARWVRSPLSPGDELEQLLTCAGVLYEAGHDLHWPGVLDGRGASKVSAPTYIFDRERYWPEYPATLTPAGRGASAVRAASPTPVRLERSPAEPAASPLPTPPRGLQLGVMFFNGSEASTQADNYRLVLEAARFADSEGFSSVWIPERHFTTFGSLYPNPATLHAALARETSRVRLMAGSVVLPLHDPLRLTEEWAVVDNLSGGRVGMSFASGWNPEDFALNPEAYADRHEGLFRGIEQVRRMWRGEAVEVTAGTGHTVRVRTYPSPVQRELPLWVTAAGNPRTFERAGAIGANLLTHLLDHDVEELAGKIARYRQARFEHGHDPLAGQVTVMLHTFLGTSIAEVHSIVREPYCRYLKENIHLLKGLAVNRGSHADVTTLSPVDLDGFVRFLYERFFSTRALLGTLDSCAPLLARLDAIGVNEVACLLDFGPSTDDVLAGLPLLRRLADRTRSLVPGAPPAIESRGAAAGPLLEHAYEIRWTPLADADRAGVAPRSVVVVGGRGVGAALASSLAAGGSVATLFTPGSAGYDRLPEADALVYAVPLDSAPAVDPTQLLGDAVAFVQAAARTPSAAKLWFVTSGSQQVLSSDQPDAAHAALWAMVRVLPLELPRRWGGAIDVEPATTPADAAAQILTALAVGVGEDQVAVRGNRLFGARLSAADVVPSSPAPISPEDAFLVTGGLRGLGLEAARWLARRGARHLVLVSRNAAADERTRSALDDFERGGVTVRVAAVDVTSREALGRLAESQRAAGLPPIRGIVHAAGVWLDRPLADLTPDELATVLAPKVAGTLALAESFPAVERFIGFSAFSALLPAESQGNYAAANAFLDAFLRAAGRPGWTSLHWGPWSDVGFATTAYGARAHARLEAIGISRIAPRDGVATLDALAATRQPGIGIMKVDWRTLFDQDPNARWSPLLRDLYARHGADRGGRPGAGRVRELLVGLNRASEVGCLEQELTRMTAAVLRLSPADISRLTSFTDLGVDSLMAVELKNRIQHETGVDVPLVKLLEGPTVADLALIVAAHITLERLETAVPARGNMTEIEI